MLCVILFCIVDILVMGVFLCRFCSDMNIGLVLVCSELGECMTGFPGFFCVMYDGWCSVL